MTWKVIVSFGIKSIVSVYYINRITETTLFTGTRTECEKFIA